MYAPPSPLDLLPITIKELSKVSHFKNKYTGPFTPGKVESVHSSPFLLINTMVGEVKDGVKKAEQVSTSTLRTDIAVREATTWKL
jgi:hypothetical protein